MRLIDELQRQVEGEESLFRAQLLREDIARLAKLEALARSAADFPEFRKSAYGIGWTQGDARTHELAIPLDALLEAVHRHCTGNGDATDDARIGAAWRSLHRLRMERLVGCLANPVPKPSE